MPGPLESSGLIAKAIEYLVSVFIDEDKVPELMKRRKLARLNKEGQTALKNHDLTALKQVVADMERIANQS